MSHLRKFGVGLAVALTLAVALAGTAGAASKPPSTPPAAPAISCGTIKWVVEAYTGTYSWSDGTSERVKLLAARDANTNAFCNETKAQSFFTRASWSPCNTFTADVNAYNTIVTEGTNYPGCGITVLNGFVQSPPANTVAGALMEGEAREYIGYPNTYDDFVFTSAWKAN